MSITINKPEKYVGHEDVIEALHQMMDEQKIDYDLLLQVIAYQFMTWAESEEHDGVKSCLVGAGERLLEASFDYYASTK